MRRVLCLAALAISLGLAVQAQRFDFAVGAGGVARNPPVTGKFWPSLSATFMPSAHFGFGAEVSHRFTGPVPKRASLMDFNLVYRPLPAARFALGLGYSFGGR